MSVWDLLIALAAMAWGIYCGFIVGRATTTLRSARIAPVPESGGNAEVDQ